MGAVALAVDTVSAARGAANEAEASPGAAEFGLGPAWRAVGAVIRCHVEMQLARVRQVRHRPERPGYVQDLYKSYEGPGSTSGSAIGGRCSKNAKESDDELQ